MTGLSVRRAVPDDAADIARVRVRSWREAYTGRMPQAILDGLDERRNAEGWGRILRGEYPNPQGTIWVGLAGDEVVGFASSGPGRDDDAVPGRVELYAIYVLADHYGSGLGRMLLDAAIGDSAASLWVLADNPRAQSFYRRNGFAPDGEVKLDDRWGDPVREIRLVRPAAPRR
jgi:ribosomal protein S18 acetylase RimI-like enzyme